jgi:hypothetical protein
MTASLKQARLDNCSKSVAHSSESGVSLGGIFFSAGCCPEFEYDSPRSIDRRKKLTNGSCWQQGIASP